MQEPHIRYYQCHLVVTSLLASLATYRKFLLVQAAMHIVTHLQDKLAQQVWHFHKLQKYLLKGRNKIKSFFEISHILCQLP